MKASWSRFLLTVAVLSLGPCGVAEAEPMGTAFTYQGQLKESAVPVNDTADFEFTLWDASSNGTQIGSDGVSGVDVVDGLFTVVLDFGGGQFAGDARWLQIAVKGSGDPGFTTLSPRQELTPTPHAIYAESAGSFPGGIGGSGTAGYLAKFVGSNGIGDSVIYESGGNVGIGTDNPRVLLEVRYPDAQGGAIGLYEVDTPVAILGDGAGALEKGILQLYEGGDEIIRLFAWSAGPSWINAGNVGIGTTNPAYKLDVSGDIRATGTIYGTIYGTVDSADKVDGYHAGNSSSQVAVSNGTVCTNLNADKVDGQHASAFASSTHDHCAENWSCGASTGLTVTGSPYGIDARGATAGGYFDDTNNSAFAYVAYGNIGIQANGSYAGGSFDDTDGTGSAILASDNRGVQGWGGYAGGVFVDTDASSYAQVAYDTYKIWGTGSVNFVQSHPNAPEQVIVYAAPEGDEVATYTRGTARLLDGVAHVPLGETFKWVTNPDIGLTAHLTPRGQALPLAVVSLTTEELVVRGPDEGPDNVVFDYLVYGLRIGFEEVSVVQEKQREAYIPSMASHRQRYGEYPELRQYNALERFKGMRATLGDQEPLDLSASHALRDAITEFDPAVHELPRPHHLRPEGQEDDAEFTHGTDVDHKYSTPQGDASAEWTQALRSYGISSEADGVVQAQQEEISVLRARLQALEAAVANLASADNGGV